MKKRKSLIQFSSIAALAVASVISIHAQQISTDYDHGANFETYHTFTFAKVETSNPLFESRVRDAVSRELQGKG